jgi:hypothetical protein
MRVRRKSSPFSSIRSKAYRNTPGIVVAVADAVEVRHPIVVAGDSLAVDDTRAGAQAGERIDDQREAAGQVVAWAAIEPHSIAILPGDDPEAVVLDLVQPKFPRGRGAWLMWAGTAR